MTAPGISAVQRKELPQPNVLRVIALDANGGEVATGQGFMLSGTNLVMAHLPPAPRNARYKVLLAGATESAGLKAYDHALGLALLQIADMAPVETPFRLQSQAVLRPGMGVFLVDRQQGAFTERRVTKVRDIPWGKVGLVAPAAAPEDAGGPVLDSDGATIGIVTRIQNDGHDGAAVVSARRLEYILKRAVEGPSALPAASPAGQRPRTTALVVSGLVAEEDGELTASLDCYRQAAEADPLCAGVHLNLGRALARANDHPAAIAEYSRAIELNGQYAAAFHFRALSHNALGRLDAARADWTRTIEISSQARQAFYNRGLVRLKQSDLDGAESDFTQAILLRTHYFHAYLGRGKVRLRRENTRGAIRDFLMAVRLDEASASAWTLLGEALARREAFHWAIGCFGQALEHGAEDAHVVLCHRGAAFARLGETASALKDLDAALARAPGYAPARAYRDRLARHAESHAQEPVEALDIPEPPDAAPEFHSAPLAPSEEQPPPAVEAPPPPRAPSRRFAPLFKVAPIALVLGVSVYGAYWMVQHRPAPVRVVTEVKPTLVEVVTARRGAEPVRVSVMGTVIPARTVALMPQVSGRVIEQSPNLVPGGRVREGEILARIDPRDYELLVEQQKAQVERAQYELKMEEGRQVVAQREWSLMDPALPKPEANTDLALRRPQLKAAQAGLAAAQSALQMAQLNLERTVLYAPFDALVQEESVEIGQFLSPPARAATLAGTRQFWVQVSVPVDKLDYIQIPDVNGAAGSKAVVTHATGSETRTVREGRVIRLLRDLDPTGRMARVIVAVDDPLALQDAARRPILLGAYVHVDIEGTPMQDVCVVPRAALREGDEVWVMDANDQLAVRKVEIVWRREDAVLVRSGIESGDRIVTNRLSTPIPGMKLRTESTDRAPATGGSQGSGA